jgi:hypothetical protein
VPRAEVHYVLAAKRSHRPGRPFNSCEPRSENFKPAPATRSVTTLETKTSLAASHHARGSMHSDSTNIPTAHLYLTGVQPCSQGQANLL